VAGIDGEEFGCAGFAVGVDYFDGVVGVKFEMFDYRDGTLGVGSCLLVDDCNM
jgi:hypothetical protein